MTSRTPSPLETGLSAVLFIENRIFGALLRSGVATEVAWWPCTSSRSELLIRHRPDWRSFQAVGRVRPAILSRPAAVRRLRSYRLAATVRLPQSHEGQTGSNRSAATTSAPDVLRSYTALAHTKCRLDAAGDRVRAPCYLISPLNDCYAADRAAVLDPLLSSNSPN